MEFRVLGPIELWSAGRRQDLGRARARSILAMLLLNPRALVPVETLIDRLWDTQPPAKARESLSVYVARLRASLRQAVGDDLRLLVVDPAAWALRELRTGALPTLLAPGDLLVVNDAATLPSSLMGRDQAGNAVEARLIGLGSNGRLRAVLFGAGDWHQRTEDRPPPAPASLAPGARLRFGDLEGVVGAALPLSPRLIDLTFDAEGDALWAALYRAGRPIAYAYLDEALPLWAVQTVYAGRPWAFEMPSAGRPLSWEILLALRRRGRRVFVNIDDFAETIPSEPAAESITPIACHAPGTA